MPFLDRHAPRLFQVTFALALAVVLAVALYPLTGESQGNGDKVRHFAVFYGLTLLGVAAFPQPRRLVWLILGLSAYGAVIEVLQPFFGRDLDVFDWVADAAGITLALLPFPIAWWRARRLSRDQ